MKYKIKYLMIIPSAALVALCWIALLLSAYFYAHTLLREGFESHRNEQTKNLRTVIANDFMTGNYLRMRGQLNQFIINSDADYVVVLDGNNAPLEWASNDENDERLLEDIKPTDFKTIKARGYYQSTSVGKMYICSLPITFNEMSEDAYGTVIVAYSMSSIDSKLSKLFLFFIATIVIALLTQTYIVNVIARRITSPLHNLIDSMRSSARSGGLFSINTGTKIEELGALQEEYNRMVENVKKAQETIRNVTALASIGQTASQIAHDVRKPLSNLKALLTVLPEKRHDERFIRKLVGSVEVTIDRTNRMLSEILEFSKDAAALNWGECNPQSLISAALGSVFTTSKAIDVSVSYEVRHVNYLKVDYDRIIRVLENIIGNAIDAMNGKGKMWVKIDCFDENKANADLSSEKRQCAGESYGKCEKWMNIVIGNDGPVIPEDIQAKLFEPFFTRNKSIGTGLGLSICKKIVELHGGSVRLESREPHITEFTIKLPATQRRVNLNKAELIHHSDELKVYREEDAARSKYGDIAAVADFMKLHKALGRSVYLLIVDDEPLFRESVRGLIDSIAAIRDHVKVVEADSAEVALKLFEARNFDYVIADIDMGKDKMNGYDMSLEILDKYPNTYVLIHSNKRREEMDKNIRGVDSHMFMGFLPKPMKQSELLQFLAGKTFEITEKKSASIEKKRKNVLVINDDETVLLSFKFMIKSPAIQVLQATNVSDALTIFRKEKIDMILADVNLGEGEATGYDFVSIVRKENVEIPIYMVSGYPASEEEKKAKSVGANGYLQLPVEQEQLQSLIN